MSLFLISSIHIRVFLPVFMLNPTFLLLKAHVPSSHRRHPAGRGDGGGNHGSDREGAHLLYGQRASDLVDPWSFHVLSERSTAWWLMGGKNCLNWPEFHMFHISPIPSRKTRHENSADCSKDKPLAVLSNRVGAPGADVKIAPCTAKVVAAPGGTCAEAMFNGSTP